MRPLQRRRRPSALLLCSTSPSLLGIALGACLAPRLGPPGAAPGTETDLREEAVVVEPSRGARQEDAPYTLPADARARLWRAGRPELQGLSAVQTAARRSEGEQALARIRASLEAGGAERAAWLSLLHGTLASLEAPDWDVAARVAGACGLVELAPLVAPGLSPEAPPVKQSAARRSLHELYGTWFAAREQVEPFLLAAPGPPTAAFVARLREAEERAAGRLFELLRLEPGRTLAALDSVDPDVRARAAMLLGEATADGRVEVAGALAALTVRLAHEDDPRAFHAELEAALAPLEGLAGDAPELAPVFELFEGMLVHGWDGRLLAVAGALPRLVYDVGQPGTSPYLRRALKLSGEILHTLFESDARRGFEDPAPMVAVIGSLSALAQQVRPEDRHEVLASAAARDGLLDILRDSTRELSTRQAAGAALAAFVGPEDLGLFETELARPGLPPGLAHVLIGAMGDLLVQVDPRGPLRDEAVSALGLIADKSGSPDPDLRRRALALLSDPSLEPLVRSLDPEFLLARLDREEIGELSRTLLVLLRRFGREEMLEELLALDSFDRLGRSEGESSAELDATLLHLAGGDPVRLLAAAERLADGRAEGAVSRLRRALELVASLDEEAARSLSPEGHARIASWAWRLHEQGVPLEEAVAPGRGFVDRLVRVHLPLAAPGAAGAPSDGPPLPERRREHLLAVLLGRQLADRASVPRAAGTDGGGPAPGAGGSGGASATSGSGGEADGSPAVDVAAVEAHFARALELAGGASDPGAFEELVRRDRARFRAAIGASEEAWADYAALLEAGTDVLQLSDLRRAGAAAVAGTSPSPERRRRAAELYLRLVGSEGWAAERQQVRLRDLQRLAELAAASEDDLPLERFVALLAGLPATAPENGAPVPSDGGPPRSWKGLVQDAEALARLVELRERATAELERRRVARGSMPAPGEDGSRGG